MGAAPILSADELRFLRLLHDHEVDYLVVGLAAAALRGRRSSIASKRALGREQDKLVLPTLEEALRVQQDRENR